MNTLYCNGDIVTMEAPGEVAEAVLVGPDGRISQCGPRERLKDAAGYRCRVVDLQGQTMLPAFIDTHSHASWVAHLSRAADASDCTSMDELLDVLAQHLSQADPDQDGFVFGFGYDHLLLREERHPTKELLNAVSTDIPLCLFHTSFHMASVNTVGLKVLGIDSKTPQPEGGHIGRVPGSLEPDGRLEETAVLPLYKKLIDQPSSDFGDLLRAAEHYYARHGITTIQDGAGLPETVQSFKTLAGQKRLQLDLVSYPLIDQGAREIMAENRPFNGRYCNRFKLGGYKLLLDGSPQARTAWLSQPYEGEEHYRGHPWHSDEEVTRFVAQALEDDCQLLTHCNGDAAADQLLRCCRKALAGRRDAKDLRPVMVHCQTIRPDQLDAMAAIGMIPSIFVAHTYFWGDIHLQNLGPERGHGISPARSALSRNLPVTFHLDSPVRKPNILQTIWSAVNRRTRSGAVVGPQERIDVYSALKAVTVHAALQYGEEEQKGSIAPGKLADFVVLDRNPLKVPAEEIGSIKVSETLKEGCTVFRRCDR